ncbi:transcriptional regulator [Oleiphilus sp. HI0132]|uniref:DeoR/GlpR family transcriptional regulator n=1 Tax=Oleiphilus sp. HI0132 TaxID=1822270 RepID=UPI0007C2B5E8|nr:DeoR/GlpR family transcriptional regulator [Oleiphilus sp. HI0132]KZZ74501.1 transcriptional regulator [Oleiphilus sp. HI0132]
MKQSERHSRIIEIVSSSGFATIEELASKFDVTPQTIRRDLKELDNENKIQRFHGGAGLSSTILNTSYSNRKVAFLKEKQRIAEAVALEIPDHSSIFINIGTTTEAIAQALLNHNNLTVITNNLHVASILSTKDDFTIIIAGGVVRNRDGGVMGEATIDFVSQFKVDYAIIGISGVDDTGDLLDFDYQEVRVSRAIVENSRNIFLAADHSKFGRDALTRLGNIAEAHHIFTSETPPESIVSILNKENIKLTVA